MFDYTTTATDLGCSVGATKVGVVNLRFIGPTFPLPATVVQSKGQILIHYTHGSTATSGREANNVENITTDSCYVATLNVKITLNVKNFTLRVND